MHELNDIIAGLSVPELDDVVAFQEVLDHPSESDHDDHEREEFHSHDDDMDFIPKQ